MTPERIRKEHRRLNKIVLETYHPYNNLGMATSFVKKKTFNYRFKEHEKRYDENRKFPYTIRAFVEFLKCL